MEKSPASTQDSAVLEINETVKRLTGTKSEFFRPCSLLKSKSSYAELRFLRGILYYYSLLCECGSAAVRFCAKQSQFKLLSRFDVLAALKIIHALRTQAAHSVEQNSNDGDIFFITRSWFRQYANTDFPVEEKHWIFSVVPLGLWTL
jgi:hypothetical protein